MRRLLPALTVMISVVAVLSIAILGPLGQQQQAMKTGLAASVFVANFQLLATPGGYFAGSAESNPFLHTWSLSVEEQFYLFLPLFILVTWGLTFRASRPAVRKRVIGGAVILVIALSFLYSWSLSGAPGVGSLQPRQAFFSSIARGWEFAVGVLLALTASHLASLPRTAANIAGVVGLGLVVGSAFAIDAQTPFPGLAATVPVVGTAMLIAAGANQANIWSARWLSGKPVVWVGDLSHSWYLWHWPFVVFARTLWPTSILAAPVAAAVALVPAAVAFYSIEQPIRQERRFPGVGGVRIAIAAIGLSVITVGFLGLSSRVIRDLPAVADMAHAIRFHIDAAVGCDTTAAEFGTHCVWLADQPEGSIYLLGDSNAGQFTEALSLAATDAAYDLSLAVRSGCPPVRLTVLQHGYVKEHCSTFPADAIDAILDDEPDVVVLAAASNIYIDQERHQILDPVTGAIVSNPAHKARLWQQALAAVLAELNAAGIEVYVVNPIPHFFSTDYVFRLENCPTLRLLTNPAACAVNAPRPSLTAQRERALSAELGAIAESSEASAVDFFDHICPGTSHCAMFSNGSWLYRDGSHLSVDGSLQLADDFYSLIAATAP